MSMMLRSRKKVACQRPIAEVLSQLSSSQSLPSMSGPMTDEGKELRTLLDFPPSASGSAAIRILCTLQEVIPQRTHASAMIEQARSEQAVIAARAMEQSKHALAASTVQNDLHRDTVEEWRRRLREQNAVVERWYEEFKRCDEIVVRCQRQLTEAYDTFRLLRSAAEDNDEDAKDAVEVPRRDSHSDVTSETSDHRVVVEAEGGRLSVGDFLSIAAKRPEILQKNIHALMAVKLLVRVQARWRGIRRRRQHHSLVKVRRFLNRECILYHFYYWRCEARGSVHRHQSLLRLGFAALQGNANMAALRRSIFAIHFAQARTISTQRRTLVMWFRYTKYLNAYVDPATHHRDVEFEQLDAWDRFLEQEERRLQLMAVGGSMLSSHDPEIVKAHFFARWWKYVLRRRYKLGRWQMATTHCDLVRLSSHFMAWVNLVSFSSQREATNFATKQHYFERWHRVVKRNIRERHRSKAFRPLRRLSILSRWRKKTVSLRRHQAASTIVFQNGFRALGLYVIYCMQSDATNAAFVGAWRRWRKCTERRVWWKSYVGMRWSKRCTQLKRLCFNAWRSALGTPEGSPSKARARGPNNRSQSKLKTTDGVGNHESFQELWEEFTNARQRTEMLRLMNSIHGITGKIAELDEGGPCMLNTSNDSEDEPAEKCGENVFPEVQMVSVSDIQREKKILKLHYNRWAELHEKGQLDHHLMNTIVTLITGMHMRQKLLELQRGSTSPSPLDLTTKASIAERTKVLTKRRSMFTLVMMCAGPPIFHIKKLEVNVSAMERHVREESMHNRVLVVKRRCRDARILKKINARIAALRLYNVSTAFSCAPLCEQNIGISPYSILMEQYDNIMAQAQSAKRRETHGTRSASPQSMAGKAKYTIPLPAVPVKRRLPFLLRQYLNDIVGPDRHKCIRERVVQRLRFARAVFLVKLGLMVSSRARTVTDTSQKRDLLVSKVSDAEYRALTLEKLAPKYHALLPPSCLVCIGPSDERRYSLLNLVGFNPQFLKGQLHAEIRRQRRFQVLMNEVASRLRATGFVVPDVKKKRMPMRDRAKLRRLRSDIGGVRVIECAEVRREVEQGRRKSLQVDADPNPFHFVESISASPEDQPLPRRLQDDAANDNARAEANPEADLTPAATLEHAKSSTPFEDRAALMMSVEVNSTAGDIAQGVSPLSLGETSKGVRNEEVARLTAQGDLEGARTVDAMFGAVVAQQDVTPDEESVIPVVQPGVMVDLSTPQGKEHFDVAPIDLTDSLDSPTVPSKTGPSTTVLPSKRSPTPNDRGNAAGPSVPLQGGRSPDRVGKPTRADSGRALSSHTPAGSKAQASPLSPQQSSTSFAIRVSPTEDSDGTSSKRSGTSLCGTPAGAPLTPVASHLAGGSNQLKVVRSSLLDKGQALKSQQQKRAKSHMVNRKSNNGPANVEDDDLARSGSMLLKQSLQRQSIKSSDIFEGQQRRVKAHSPGRVTREEIISNRAARQAAADVAKQAVTSAAENERALVRGLHVPRIWGGDIRTVVPSLERLLEISARYTSYLNASSRAYLSDLKNKLYSITTCRRGGATPPPPTASLSLGGGTSPNRIRAEQSAPPARSPRQPLYSAPLPKFRYQAHARRTPEDAAASPPASPNMPSNVVGSATSFEVKKSLPRSADGCTVVVDPEPVRRQLLLVPRYSCELQTLERMKSTARLLNDLREDEREFRKSLATVEDLARMRRHNESRTDTSSWDRPWREPPTSEASASLSKRQHPAPLRGEYRRHITENEKREIAEERANEAREARRRVREKELRNKCADTSDQVDNDFDSWVEQIRRRLSRPSSEKAAAVEAEAELALLGRRAQKLDQYVKTNDETSDHQAQQLAEELQRQMSILSAAIQQHRQTGDFAACSGARKLNLVARKGLPSGAPRQVTTSKGRKDEADPVDAVPTAEGPLRDTDVARLVTFILQTQARAPH